MKRPVLLTIAAVCVLVLILISAVWPMVGGDRLLGLSTFPARGNFQGQTGIAPQGTPTAQMSTPQGGTNSSQSGMGPGMSGNNTGFQPGFQRGNRGGFAGNRVLEYVLYAVELALGLIAIGGLWVSKLWGKILAVITAAIVAIATVPSLLRVFSTVTLVEDLLKIALAIGIIVLVLVAKAKLNEQQAVQA